MSVDYSKPPLDNLMELLNAKSTVAVKASDFMDITKPVVLTGDPSGRNTMVSLRTTLEFTHAGRVEARYDRRPLAEFINASVNVTVNDDATFADAIAAYRDRYGIYMDAQDIEAVGPFDVSGGEPSYIVPVRSPLNSYGYTGTANLQVNVAWRLVDPELMESAVDRLYQIVHHQLPETITSYY